MIKCASNFVVASDAWYRFVSLFITINYNVSNFFTILKVCGLNIVLQTKDGLKIFNYFFYPSYPH